jgi:hypothetical protein
VGEKDSGTALPDFVKNWSKSRILADLDLKMPKSRKITRFWQFSAFFEHYKSLHFLGRKTIKMPINKR